MASIGNDFAFRSIPNYQNLKGCRTAFEENKRKIILLNRDLANPKLYRNRNTAALATAVFFTVTAIILYNVFSKMTYQKKGYWTSSWNLIYGTSWRWIPPLEATRQFEAFVSVISCIIFGSLGVYALARSKSLDQERVDHLTKQNEASKAPIQARITYCQKNMDNCDIATGQAPARDGGGDDGSAVVTSWDALKEIAEPPYATTDLDLIPHQDQQQFLQDRKDVIIQFRNANEFAKGRLEATLRLLA